MNSVQLNIGLLFHVSLCLGFPIKEVNNKALAELSTRGYELELRKNRILFTAAYSIQFVRVNRDLFLVENSTCINMKTKETLVCRSYREDKNMQTLDVNLDGIVELKHVGLVYRLQHTFDEIRVYACLLRPTNTSLVIEKIILKVTDEFQLRLRVQVGTGAFDEVTAEHNNLRILPCSSEEEQASNCTNSESSGILSEIHYNAKISGQMYDRLAIRINRTMAFAQMLVSEDLQSTTSDILEENTPLVSLPNTTVKVTQLDDASSIQNPATLIFCLWQFSSETAVKTLFHGPCSDFYKILPDSANSTQLNPVPPTRETVAMDRFMYHEFDKAENLTDAMFYWIIDTRNFTIESFECFDDYSVICSSSNATNPCEFIYKDNMAIFVHHLHSELDCGAGARCDINGRYLSIKGTASSASTNETDTDGSHLKEQGLYNF